jgi:hypothetical protein
MARRKWSKSAARRVADRSTVVLPPATSADLISRHLCALCSREARGTGYTHELRFDWFPTYAFCSGRCMDAGSALARRCSGVIDKTCMETQAIKDARRYFAEVLTEMALLAPFHDRSPAEIDRIIEACIDGFQDSMQRQAAQRDPMDSAIPF